MQTPVLLGATVQGAQAPAGSPSFTEFSIVKVCVSRSVAAFWGAGNNTVANKYLFLEPFTLQGVRFFWPAAAPGGQSVKVTCWNEGGTLIASKTVIPTPNTIHTASFDTPITTVANQIYSLGIYETSGTNYVAYTFADLAVAPRLPAMVGANIMMLGDGSMPTTSYSAGDAFPDQASTTGRLLEPYF